MAGGQTLGGQFITDPRSRRLIERPRMHIDGEWLDGAGEIYTKVNPTTGETLAGIPLAGPAQVSRALAAARRAFDDGAWSRTSPVTQARTASSNLRRKNSHIL